MNNLFKKIAVMTVGLTMAIGVGVAVSRNSDVKAAEAATTWTQITSVSDLVSGTYIMGVESTAGSKVIIPLRSDGANATTSANGYFYTGTTAGSGTSTTINLSSIESTSAYEVTITKISNGVINIQNAAGNYYGATSGGATSNKGRLYTSGNSNETNLTVELSSSKFRLTAGVSGSYKYMKYNSGSPRYAFYNSGAYDTSFYKKTESKTVTGITKKTAPTKTAYLSGTEFDPSGLEITVTYSDSTSDDITYVGNESDFSWTPTTITAAGNVSIQYKTYSSYKVTQAVTLATVTSVTSVASSPESVAIDGEVLPSEVTLNVQLSNGDSAVVNATSIDLDTSVAGKDIQGTAYYNSVGSATFTIDVLNVVVYTKHTGAIVEGDYVICSGTNAMKNTATSSPRIEALTVSPQNDKITNPDESIIWHVSVDSTYDEYWNLYNEDAEVYAAFTSTDGRGTLLASITDYARWQFSGSSTYELTNKGKTSKYLRYNSGYGFASYAQQTGEALTLYKAPTTSKCRVTYNANGATGGNVPEDSTAYDPNATVTVKGNTGSLVKTNFTWNGWNTKADGSGEHYAANDTFTIAANTTLYAEWVKALDTISSFGGYVTATLSQSGTYNWDFSNLTVTGTLSGASGQDVKNYVDLTSSTQVPGSIGEYTVSVTATKKTSVPGSATALTDDVTGEVEAAKLVYTFTMTQADLLQTNVSYVNENAHAKYSTATCADHDSITIDWATNQVMKSTTDMQFQTTNGYLYNTTEIPGTITSVEVTATAQSFTVYYGDSEHPTSGTTPGGKFFTVQGVGSTPKASQIVVTFEVSDKPKVQLVGTHLDLDVADGAASAVITDGSSPVTGYTLISEDDHIASITQDTKIQPVGYGTVTIHVSKEEDAGHIYLAGTFTVFVGDHSKEDSIMTFVEKANGSATADDGVVWTINSGDITENDFSDVYGINFGTNGAKIDSLIMTTPADEDRIIKNVVVEAMSATDGSTITVSVGGVAFTCSKANNLNGNVTTFNFSGHASGAITITMSGTTKSTKYGVKSIAVLYVGDEAQSFAATFLGAVACNASGTSKPTFNKKDAETYWTWALLADEFDELSASDKAKFAKGATGVSSTIVECVNRYDYIVGKYYVTGIDLSFTDFMSRSPSAVGATRLVVDTAINNTGTVVIITTITVVSLAAIGGYFLLRKKKEI